MKPAGPVQQWLNLSEEPPGSADPLGLTIVDGPIQCAPPFWARATFSVCVCVCVCARACVCVLLLLLLFFGGVTIGFFAWDGGWGGSVVGGFYPSLLCSLIYLPDLCAPARAAPWTCRGLGATGSAASGGGCGEPPPIAHVPVSPYGDLLGPIGP